MPISTLRTALVAPLLINLCVFSEGIAFAQARTSPPSAPSGSPNVTNTNPTNATANSSQEARAHYTRGAQLYKDGNPELALIEFQRAYELAPSYKILFNIGQVNFEINKYAEALKAFEKYLVDGGKELTAKRKAEVEKEVADLKARTAHITITTNIPGADISIDGVSIGITPLGDALLIDAGRHKITASKSGRVETSKPVTLAGGDNAQLQFDLPEVPPASATPIAVAPLLTQSPQAGPDKAALSTAGPQASLLAAPPSTSYVWLGWVATGALAAGATTTGILALISSSDLRTMKTTVSPVKADLDRQDTKTKNLALATDVLAGASLAVGAVTLYYTLHDGSENKSHEATVRVGLYPTGVQLNGRF